jgi:hypothetical protein
MRRKDQLLADHCPAEKPENNWQEVPNLFPGPLQGPWLEARKMKILLIYPEFPDPFWSFKHALKFIRKKAGAPPLGLLTVAAMLSQDHPSKYYYFTQLC